MFADHTREMFMSLPPPLTELDDLDRQLATSGFAVLDAANLSRLGQSPVGTYDRWNQHWNDLPPDAYLRDGGRYRRRRHACFQVELRGEPTAATMANVTRVPHRPHWQPLEYNALHGGIERWFEPMADGLANDPAWVALLLALAQCAARLRGQAQGTWFVEAHPFRIDTTDGIGRPTPEGAHRDGVELVVVILVGRVGIKGGETRVFDTAGPQGMRFTLAEPWSALLLDDERMIHETTPIQPIQPGAIGHRDTLVLTLRRGGFQGPSTAPVPDHAG